MATDNTCSKQWLRKAIDRHKRHMMGEEPTTGKQGDISQRLMMEEMQYALMCLNDKFKQESEWYLENNKTK